MRLRALLGALVIAAGIGVVVDAPRALAAPGGAMTAVNGTFTGTAGDDVLVISHDAELLTHNRFGALDPGFASATDFDSTVEGVQTKSRASDTIGFVGAAGDDTVQFVGDVEAALSPMNFGDGNDTLDLADLGGAAVMGPRDPSALGATDPSLERIDGTPFDDVLFGSASAGAVGITIFGGGGDDFLRGTAANDTLDAGPGVNEIHAGGGNDNLSTAGPLPPQPAPALDGGDGDDALSYRATDGADDLEISYAFQGLFIRDNVNNNGRFARVEQAFISLAGGDDSVFVTAPELPLVIAGNGGNDEVVLDMQKTAVQQFDHVDGVRRLRVPNAVDGHIDLVGIHDDVESASVLNETVVATAPGPGGGPHVRTFRADGTPVASFFAYTPEFHGGVSVALGDLDGDVDDEIVTGAGPGGGPHVRVFRSDGTDTGVGFMAYDNFTGGVNVGTVDIDGDGVDEIVTVPATGGGPHVRVWSADGDLIDEWFANGFVATGLNVSKGTRVNQIFVANAGGAPTRAKIFTSEGAEPLPSFLNPYGGFGGGATVTRGRLVKTDVNPLQLRELYITGAGAGGGPHVRIFEFRDDQPQCCFGDLGGFFAYDQNFHGGLSVTTCNPDGLSDEIVTGPGPGGGPHVRMFSLNGTALPLSFMAYDPAFGGGVRVACGGAETRAY